MHCELCDAPGDEGAACARCGFLSLHCAATCRLLRLGERPMDELAPVHVRMLALFGADTAPVERFLRERDALAALLAVHARARRAEAALGVVAPGAPAAAAFYVRAAAQEAAAAVGGALGVCTAASEAAADALRGLYAKARAAAEACSAATPAGATYALAHSSAPHAHAAGVLGARSAASEALAALREEVWLWRIVGGTAGGMRL